MASTTELLEVTDAQLVRYGELIYERTGVRISAKKKALLSNRLRRRLRETGIADFEQYYRHLRKLRSNDPEWDAFFQEITTHESYLFRDEAQWRWFRETYLPQCASEAREGGRPRSLRFWSAAASTGDEAYTIACCVEASLSNPSQWKVEILGTDIGLGALEKARQASFGARAMKLVPSDLKRRFFEKDPHREAWTPRAALSAMITFRQHNLLDPLRERPFDIVFLKNVLIYFDPESKAKVVKHLRAVVKPGGLLVAGGSEGISDLMRDVKLIHPWLFRFPA